MTGIPNERERKVLRAVVENHIDDPTPVASRTLSGKNLSELGLSPATIRNVMAALDDMGYITQPHTSAGRVPTDKGYRFFTDELMTARKLATVDRRKINHLLGEEKEAAGGSLAAVSRILTAFSRQAAMVLLPNMSTAVIERFYFIKISDLQVQVVLKTSFGGVENLLVEIDENWPENELAELANFINAKYSGNSLRAIRDKLKKQLKREKARANRLRKRALKIQDKIMSKQDIANLIVEGTSMFLDAPEFGKDAEKLKTIFRIMADKKRLLKILDKCLDETKINANIGSELEPVGFENCSLVTISYGREINRPGAIGVIGPRRMDYAYVYGLLEYVAYALDRMRVSE